MEFILTINAWLSLTSRCFTKLRMATQLLSRVWLPYSKLDKILIWPLFKQFRYSNNSRSVSEGRSDSRGRSQNRDSLQSISDQEPECGQSHLQLNASACAGSASSPLNDSNYPSTCRGPGIDGQHSHSGRVIQDGRGVGLYRKTSEDTQTHAKRTVVPALAIESAPLVHGEAAMLSVVPSEGRTSVRTLLGSRQNSTSSIESAG